MTDTPPTDARLTLLMNSGTTFLTITQDGQVIPGEGLTMDEVAERFLTSCSEYVHRLRIRLTDREHALIALRADLEEQRERGDRLCVELESHAVRFREAIDGWRRLVPHSKPTEASRQKE